LSWKKIKKRIVGGNDLSKVSAKFSGCRQILNIPPIRPIVTESTLSNVFVVFVLNQYILKQ
jgi:hypothetical protein